MSTASIAAFSPATPITFGSLPANLVTVGPFTVEDFPPLNKSSSCLKKCKAPKKVAKETEAVVHTTYTISASAKGKQLEQAPQTSAPKKTRKRVWKKNTSGSQSEHQMVEGAALTPNAEQALQDPPSHPGRRPRGRQVRP